jgi:phosphoadenosine phosphosulfate reductase
LKSWIKMLREKLHNLSWEERLRLVVSQDRSVFSTSFSIEDQVITDFIVQNKLPVDIFTLDTGRLPNETYQVWQETLDNYGIRIKAYYPDEKEIANFVEKNGINSFYRSKEFRLECCRIRKVGPLKKALEGYQLWISGIRKEHSPDRQTKDFFEEDSLHQLTKFYPLLEMSEDEVWEIIRKKSIPYNKLYDQGYRSIGCAPCSRAISHDENIRAGRWWWEEKSGKECGLHLVNGRLVRKKN